MRPEQPCYVRLMARTKTEEALEAAERTHADDPERADLLARARRFKASWLELAEALSAVRRSGQWKQWGYASFEDYTRKELHLRQETVDKLTGSYVFLQRRAPEVLQRDGVAAPVPSYQAIDFLRRAEETEAAPAETLAELRRRVIDEGAPLPTLSRKYREVVFPLDDSARRERDVGQLRAAAKRLHELLGASETAPRALRRDLERLLTELLEALAPDEEEQAA
jgi:hypothetical protein